jgi:hypothetical protein
VKYTICGYQQDILIEYNLDAIDATILDYIDNFYNTGKMYHKIINNYVYFWVNYRTIIDDLPILNIIDPQSIAYRFNKYIDCELMKKVYIKGKDIYLYDGKELERHGSFTYFCFLPDKKLRLVGDNENKKSEMAKKDPYKRRLRTKGLRYEGLPFDEQPRNDLNSNPVTVQHGTKDSYINNPYINNSFIMAGAEIFDILKNKSIKENIDPVIEDKYYEVLKIMMTDDPAARMNIINDDLYITYKYSGVIKWEINKILDGLGVFDTINIIYKEL